MKKNIYRIILAGFFIFALYYLVKGYIIKFDIENNGKESVGKYILHDSWGKGETNTFEYFIDDIKYHGNGGRAPEGFKNKISKFYRIQYSVNYKGSLQANFGNEVTDTTEIIKAGFSKDDIGN